VDQKIHPFQVAGGGPGWQVAGSAEARRDTVQKCKSAYGLCKSAKVWNEKGVGAGVGVVSLKGKPETGGLAGEIMSAASVPVSGLPLRRAS
jgi:hypothetical protein